MRRELHLDISEIAVFAAGPRSEQCDETLRHLLKCRDCRSLLPMPTSNEFWRSILDDRRQPPAEDTDEARFSLVTSISRLRGWIGSPPMLTRSTVAATVLFLAIAGLSMLLIYGRIAKTGNGTMAQIGEEIAAPVNSGERIITVDSETSSNLDTSTKPPLGTKPSDSQLRNRQADRIRPVVNSGMRHPGLPINPAIKPLKPSETRGSGKPCGETPTVGLDLIAIESGMRLSWEKVVGAVSYTVYLSDLDERLIDQFETETETSYITTSKLAPETMYKWKLVVSLTGGRMLLATSRNFRPIDFKEIGGGQKVVRGKKTIARVRCTEDKK